MELVNTVLVQGLDYAYILHGWLKGVNGNYLSAANDMGKDRVVGGTRAVVGRDVYAYTFAISIRESSGRVREVLWT